MTDHFNDLHAEVIAQTFEDHPFLTGSSGLAESLARVHAKRIGKANVDVALTAGTGPTLILAGSCSEATRSQVQSFMAQYEGYRLDPDRLNSDNKSYLEDTWRWIEGQQGRPCLVYSSDDPEQVQRNQQDIGHDVAALLESAFAKIASKAVTAGYTRLVVAGGETSGAVTQALGENRFRVGPSITPGVPIIQPRGKPQLLMALKSGNFGDADFFLSALSQMNQTSH